MAQYIMDQGGGLGIHIPGDFVDAAAADTAANAINIFGTPVERSVWEATPAVQAQVLACEKVAKGQALNGEGKARIELVIPGINVEAAIAAALMTNNLNSLGNSVKALVVAYNTASGNIKALPTVAAVRAYDVRNDPGWP